MVFPDGVHVIAVHDETAEAHIAFGRDGHGVIGPRVEPPKPAIREVAEDHGPGRHGIRAAAVLMDTGADVPRLGEHIGDLTCRAVVADQDGASALPRATLEPIGVGAIHGDLVQLGLGSGEGRGRDR